ncbi:Uncaracterized surface protein containing fasciclin (FAS1) repeats [Lutibacter flavus]|uniref:Uncaracterized surface protein containing fasciclin (FAS1) repeats n=2 Tax=Lutibacter flavus TaxID=691689 RepID=A0A238VAS0_9FLAO|nr:Uncaracterized surface protein containing fasciclin (FAS1) repeats [Lutibacter flavus]
MIMVKISKILYRYVFAFIALTFITSCDEDEVKYPLLGEEPRNLTEILSETPDLSSLLNALSQVGLDETLGTQTTYTLFAPNNNAFSGVDFAAMDSAALSNILLNHLIETGTADFTSKMATGYLQSMATGPGGNNLSFYTNNSGSIIFNGVASLVSGAYDKGATNGILHTVDALLLPPTVVAHARANSEYTMFADAIAAADLSETLNGAGPFTVFAPNNTAFSSFLTEVNGAFGWSSLGDIPVDILKDVIQSHVVSGVNFEASAVDGKSPVTMQGGSISVAGTVIDDATYSNANIVLTDIQGVNGIVHGIDKVLLSEEVFQSVLSATLNMADRCADKGYTTFLAAIDKAGMTEDFKNNELTGFIPTNDAFTIFFIGIENYGSLDDFVTEEDIAVLKGLLEYHLYAGKLLSSNLTDGGTITTLLGDDIAIDLSGDNPKLIPSFSEGAKATIENLNIGASNGVIHQINKILIPSDLAQSLGIAGAGGLQPVADNAFVYFDFNGNGFDSWWGDVAGNPVSDAAASADGTPFFDATGVQGGGWNGLFFRNGGNNFTPAAIGTNLEAYEFKFDINMKAPTTGVIKFRFQGSIGDVFYDYDLSQIEESGWVTVVLPANLLGVSDFSLVDGEFGAAYSGDSMLNFSLDNVRFEEAGGGIEPVADDAYVYFDFNGAGFDSWWGDVPGNPVTDAANSADGTPFFNATGVQGGGWNGLFFRNGGDNFTPAAIGTDINNYAFKFDINVIEAFADGVIKFRFQGSIGDVFYSYDPTELEGGKGWQTITIPASTLGVSDFSQVDGEFGAAYSDGTSMLNFSLDNIRFEKL